MVVLPVEITGVSKTKRIKEARSMPKATMVPGVDYQLRREVQVEGTHGKAKLQKGAWRTPGHPMHGLYSTPNVIRRDFNFPI